MSSFPWLTVTGAIPLAGAVVISLVPGASAPGGEQGRQGRNELAKWLALGFSLATLVITIVMAVRFKPDGPDFQFAQSYQWIPAFGVHYAVGVDEIGRASCRERG